MSETLTFYPNLGTIITVDNFPEVLSFLKPKLQEALNSIYFRNFQFIKNPNGSQASYDLELIVPNGLDFDIFNTGFSIVINSTEDESPLVVASSLRRT